MGQFAIQFGARFPDQRDDQDLSTTRQDGSPMMAWPAPLPASPAPSAVSVEKFQDFCGLRSFEQGQGFYVRSPTGGECWAQTDWRKE